MKYENVIVGALETNCYLAFCPETLKAAVIDPGADPEKIFAAIAENGLKPVILINTHGHVDHIGANRDIKEKIDIPLCIHEADAPMLDHVLTSEIGFFLNARESPPPDRFLKDGEVITIGKSRMTVIHTPGHSRGSISLLTDSLLFSGDTLFSGGVGRTDLPGGSWDELVRSIQHRILVLPEPTTVLPGHGPHTTVGEEKLSNPFLR